MSFHREYKMLRGGKVQVIGSKSEDCRPYLRIEDKYGNFIGSVDGASLYHLRNALSKAILINR